MANAVLLIWPVVALVLFASLGREKGLIWTITAGYLLLPERTGFELPGLPDYDKLSALSFSVLLGYIFFRHRPSWPVDNLMKSHKRTDRLGLMFLALIGVLCLSAAMTVSENGFALVDADRVRRGLSRWDMVAMISTAIIRFVPFFIAWRLLRAPVHHEEILKILVFAGLAYSLAAIYEMRMSPQLNRTLYGYFPHAWLQHVRGGSFRPIVFLSHGLWLAFFLLTASLAAFGLYRARDDKIIRALYLGSGLWIVAVLFISPNLGAAILALVFLPLVLFASRTVLARVAMLTAVFFLAFPSIRQTDVLPLDSFVSFVGSNISIERAQSLQFRLDNEDDMVARAAQQPAFGWGGWGRWRVIDEKGRDTTVSDGLWIIILGERGWVGYLSFFGVLTLPLLLLSRVSRNKEMSVATGTIAMIGAANLVYLVPNSALSPIGWLLAGAVAGFISWRPAEAIGEITEVGGDVRPNEPRYSRFAPKNTDTVRLRRSDHNLSYSRF